MSFRKDTHIQHHSNVVNIKQHNEQISTNAKLDTLILSNDNIEPLLTDIKTNTANIKASISLGGDLYVSQDEVEAKLDTLIGHNDGVETLLTALDTAQDLTNGKLDTLDNTLSNGGIYQAQIHIRDINLPQLHNDIHAFKDANHTDFNTVGTKLDTLEASNQLNKGFLEQIEGHIETMSENQSTFQSGDNVVVSGVSTSANQTTLINNGIRSWGTAQTIEGNLIVNAGATHSGSSSFTTIPTKPILVYVKSHNAITDWFATLQGSIDNSNWFNIKQTEIIINPQGLRETPAQQNAELITPTNPYLRVVITNQNSANRGFEIKIIQTT